MKTLFGAVGVMAVLAVPGSAAADPIDAGPPPLASGEPSPLPSPSNGGAPDPPPLVTRHQWVLDFAYQSGVLSIAGSRRVELPKPTATARLMGRFAVELYVGKELIERVRFDFPLLGAEDSAGAPRRWDAPVSFERHLSSTTAVMVPHSERATRARLVDRASGRAWTLQWPPGRAVDGGPPLISETTVPPRAPAPPAR